MIKSETWSGLGLLAAAVVGGCMPFTPSAAPPGPAAEAPAAAPAAAPRQGTDTADRRAEVPTLFRELTFRAIGPAVTGGRLHDVEALPDDPSTVYVAAASGGIWKSVDKGTTWRPMFEDQGTSTFGDLAIAPSNGQVIWAGTGEQNNRQSTSWGSGVYRSNDSGETWAHVGLTDTRHIGRVLVHPEDPAVAWVAAQGNLWRPSPERGVYRTTDGGASWARVLFVDTMTGGTDLAMDGCDPDIIYAATYQRLRRTWGFNGGGPGSGVWRSTDGGTTWTRVENGLPVGDKGRIGLAAAADRCGVVNAIVEHAEASGVYRTEDGGESWFWMSGRNIRPMYYSHIFIDPTDADRVYALATYSGRSEDGGRTWTDVSGRWTYDVGVHSDHHSMWIDPNDPDHYYLAGDGGLYETWNRGGTYMRLNNIPVAQAYAIGADARDPYNVYVGLQDNHSWMGPSATRHWAGILDGDWRQIGFSDGMYHQTVAADPRTVYSNNENGGYNRVDTETGDRVEISPRAPASEPDYRFDWVAPSLASAHDPGTIYAGGNRLFISRDRGGSWERTPDLTYAADRDTLELMGVPGAEIALSRNDGTSSYGEITTIAESPLDPDILWVGADDGSLQVSRDGGASWTRVDRDVAGVPAGTYVSRVAASRTAPGAAYATFDAHRDGDFRPYVARTTDFGRSWTQITTGLDGAGSANVVAEHPDNPAVLFLGTEHALWVSLDAGARWQRLGVNLPTTLYDDLLVHPRTGDLVVATHGRGVFILDDAAPLADLTNAAGRAYLFPARDATLRLYWKDESYRGHEPWDGANPPAAVFSYHFDHAVREARLVIERDGRTVRTLDVDLEPGVIHRVTWDLRYAPLDESDDPPDPRLAQPVGDRGPLVATGTYTATLEADGATSSRTFRVRGDPGMPMLDDEDYRAREAFLLELRDIQVAIDSVRARHADTDRLDSLARRAGRLARELMGGSTQQGTLHPPTPTQRERLAGIRADWEALQ